MISSESTRSATLLRSKNPVMVDMFWVVSNTGTVAASAVRSSVSVKVESLARRGSGTGVTQGQALSMKKA